MSNFSNRQFHFSLVPTIAYILFMLLLLSLGQWQLERAQLKQNLFDNFSANDSSISTLPEALNSDNPRYKRVQVTGRFLNSQHYLLDNMVNSESVPGRHVYTPMQLENGQTILVNRGWIARRSEAEPRDSLLIFLAAPLKTTTITGRLDTLRQPGLVLDTQIPDGDYPKTVQFPNFDQLEQDLQFKLAPYQLLLDASEGNKGGFLREWKPHEMGPERHLGYAFQWFALALTLTIIYLVLSFRKKVEP